MSHKVNAVTCLTYFIFEQLTRTLCAIKQLSHILTDSYLARLIRISDHNKKNYYSRMKT